MDLWSEWARIAITNRFLRRRIERDRTTAKRQKRAAFDPCIAGSSGAIAVPLREVYCAAHGLRAPNRRAQMASALARGRAAQDPIRSREAQVLRAGHVPLPVRL